MNNPIIHSDPSGHYTIALPILLGTLVVGMALLVYVNTPEYQRNWMSMCSDFQNGIQSLKDRVISASDAAEDSDDSPDNPKKVDADYLKGHGFDPHTLKKDTLGRNADISKYDTYVDKNGDIWLQKKDGSEYIPTYENIGR